PAVPDYVADGIIGSACCAGDQHRPTLQSVQPPQIVISEMIGLATRHCREETIHGCARTAYDGKGVSPPRTLSDALLFLLLSRPRECRFRGPGNEQGPRFLRVGLRLWRRHSFHYLYAVRNAVQPRADQGRPPPLDRPHHGDLGSARLGHGLYFGREQLLRHARLARRRGGGILPRYHLLSDHLVPR